jgi:hypothetical protein
LCSDGGNNKHASLCSNGGNNKHASSPPAMSTQNLFTTS